MKAHEESLYRASLDCPLIYKGDKMGFPYIHCPHDNIQDLQSQHCVFLYFSFQFDFISSHGAILLPF